MALLYAYSTAEDYTNQEENPIKLVISEAGPTDLVAAALTASPYYKGIFKNLIGVEYGDVNWESAYNNASPSYIASQTDDELPFTVYARGANDQVVYYAQNANLVKALLPSSIWNNNEETLEGLIISNNEQLTNASNCAFFSFANCGHNDFGEYANGTAKKIHPDSTETDSLKQVIENYYDKIQEKLT